MDVDIVSLSFVQYTENDLAAHLGCDVDAVRIVVSLDCLPLLFYSLLVHLNLLLQLDGAGFVFLRAYILYHLLFFTVVGIL